MFKPGVKKKKSVINSFIQVFIKTFYKHRGLTKNVLNFWYKSSLLEECIPYFPEF